MQAFTLHRAASTGDATRAAAQNGAAYIAGGTDLMQLMRDNIEAPAALVDLDRLPLREITVTAQGARLGALATMADVAADRGIVSSYPVISQALLLSASPQIRNMGTVGGNLLQRARCLYFRDSGMPCNKRAPGSGCPAIAGDNREHAVLGGSAHCIAVHPSDMPVALMALDASVGLVGPDGVARTVKLSEFYRLPGDTPHIETVLRPGELITHVDVPPSAAAARSAYLKVRDRTSFSFALVSAAVALDIADGVIRDARVAMGGVGTHPWRMQAVEAALRGQRAENAVFEAASRHASDGAQAASMNGFKLPLMQRVALRALRAVAV